MPQPLHAVGRFPAGNEQPQRVTLLTTHRLAILRVGHHHVVQRFRQRKRVRKLVRVRPFRHQPARPFLQARLFQQHGKRHAGPFAATGHPVYELDGRHLRIAGTVMGRAVCVALQEINPGDGRQSLQLLHGETQRPIHHAVDREAMLLGIDVGQAGGMGLHEMERGRCDDSHRILKRSVMRNVARARCDRES